MTPIKKTTIITIITIITLVIIFTVVYFISSKSTPIKKEPNQTRIMDEQISLPPPETSSETSIEEALQNRRSIRSYTEEEMTLEEVSQLVWAAQGITDPDGKRSAPSAGGTYPLEVYVTIERVNGLTPGIYSYNPSEHTLSILLEGEYHNSFSNAALGQRSVEQAAANIILTAIYERTAGRYGDIAERYVHMEAGHAAQNVYLQCESLNLGTVVIGAFDEAQVSKLLQLPENETPLYIIPIGKKST